MTTPSTKNFATRDTLNGKIVGRPTVFKGPARKKVASAPGNVDHVAISLGGSPTHGAAVEGQSAETQKIEKKQGELDIGARRKRLTRTGGIATTAGLAGMTNSADDTNNNTNNTNNNNNNNNAGGTPAGGIPHPSKRHFQGVNNNSADACEVLGTTPTVYEQQPEQPHHSGKAHFKDPLALRDSGAAVAAGVPTKRRPSTAASAAAASGTDQQRRFSAMGSNSVDVKGSPKNAILTGEFEAPADGARRPSSPSSPFSGSKRVLHKPAVGSTYANVMAGSGTEACTNNNNTNNNNNKGSTTSRGGARNGGRPQRFAQTPKEKTYIDDSGRKVTRKPFATDDSALSPRNNNNNNKFRSGPRVGAAYKGNPNNKTSLLGVLKADPSIFSERKVERPAPWDADQSHVRVTQRGHAVTSNTTNNNNNNNTNNNKGNNTSAISANTNGMACSKALETHMDGVLKGVDEVLKPNNAIVATNCGVGRRARVTPAHEMGGGGGGGGAKSSQPQGGANNNNSTAATTKKRDLRPVWAQTPRIEVARFSVGAVKRSAAGAPAPWATTE